MGFFNKFFGPKEIWTVVATKKERMEWTYTSNGKDAGHDIITWFMEESNLGRRRYYSHTYGTTKLKNAQVEKEAPMILWEKTGILPENSEGIEFTAIKSIK